MNIKIVTLLFILNVSTQVFAHGMNKPGPHNGFIKMPGNFHTELINEPSLIKIYLLDISFNNLTTLNTKVTIDLLGKKNIKIECDKQKDFFICNKSNIDFNEYNQISVLIIRNNKNETSALYKLPLKFE
jgi:hypothetical protein